MGYSVGGKMINVHGGVQNSSEILYACLVEQKVYKNNRFTD